MEWLGDILTALFDLFPRIAFLPPTEGGLRTTPRGGIKVLTGGDLYWHWPAFTNTELGSIARQSFTNTQTLTTADLETVNVGTVTEYNIVDVEKAFLLADDLDDVIADISQQSIVHLITLNNFDDIVKDLATEEEINYDVTRAVRKQLRPYGVKVHKVFINNFTVTEVFSHDGMPGFVGGTGDSTEN
jgi:regulator of protease activity HflC (stomatin/prohibitin superfamily)